MTQDDDTVQAPAKRRAKPASAPKAPRKPKAAAVATGDVADANPAEGERTPKAPRQPKAVVAGRGDLADANPAEGERTPKAPRKLKAAVAGPGDVADANPAEGERIAKAMARAGLCSRRDAEFWIADGRVTVNGIKLTTPAVVVKPGDRVTVDGEPLPLKERTRLFLYHKPKGLVTTSRDPEGRPTVFERLPDDMPRVISVGRLDINTEGLLLLTNDGGLARVLELPATGWLRRYRVRAFGQVTAEQLAPLADGVTIDGIAYGPVEASIDTVTGSNVWLLVGLREGKNREVKRILEHLGLTVNRLIRVSFGPFQLADLEEGEIREIRGRVLRDQLGKRLVDDSGADFDAPIVHHLHGEDAPQKGRQRRDEDEAKPKRRAARAEKMEFIGTSEDGSRQARLTRTGKPPVAVTILPSKGKPERPVRGRPVAGKPGGFRNRPDGDAPRGRGDRDDRPARSEGFRGRGRAPGAEAGGKPYKPRSEGSRSHEGPARPRSQPYAAEGERKPRDHGPRSESFGGGDRRDDAGPNRRPPRDAGDRPMRSEGFRGRDRAPEGDAAGAKSYKPRSEGFRSHEGPAGGPKGGRGKASGFRDRPDGGLAPRTRAFDKPREAREDRPRGDRPQGDRPRGDRPQGDRPREDRPRNDRPPRGDRPQGDRPRGDRPQSDRPRGDRPQGDRPRGDRPQGDRPREDRPRNDRPQGDRPRGDRPQGDRPRGGPGKGGAPRGGPGKPRSGPGKGKR
ncbi:MAG: pseudouridine synthase [Ancalomicrobiaceae bacterium]|nr:pseudouridine synthase [Ancalomicrobiaceae bacterium]